MFRNQETNFKQLGLHSKSASVTGLAMISFFANLASPDGADQVPMIDYRVLVSVVGLFEWSQAISVNIYYLEILKKCFLAKYDNRKKKSKKTINFKKFENKDLFYGREIS